MSPSSSALTAKRVAFFDADCLVPGWSVPACVRAFTTVRAGGVSRGPYGLADGQSGGMNLGTACGDDPQDVAHNRQRLSRYLPGEPVWLQQVHGTQVWLPDRASRTAANVGSVPTLPVADAAVTSCPGTVLVIQTADCLPVFFASDDGRHVGVAHAGWRGLVAGVLEQTLTALRDAADSEQRWHAWFGPAIGPDCFEVGDEVRDAFLARDSDARTAFRPTGQPSKWWADLYALARRRLISAGVSTIGGGGDCTVSDPHRFYSYRRDRQTGRMASLIWVDGGTADADGAASQ